MENLGKQQCLYGNITEVSENGITKLQRTLTSNAEKCF